MSDFSAETKISTLDVLMCIDREFIMPTGVTMISLLANNPHLKFYFHICVADEVFDLAKTSLQERIYKLYDKSKCEFLFYRFSDFEGYKSLSQRLNKRIAAQCVRLFLGEIEDYKSDYVLYLDADLICLKALDLNLLRETLNDKVLVATCDPKHCELACGREVAEYFWSSVLFINLKKWREYKIGEKSINLVIKFKPKYPDQDALNVALEDLVSFFDSKWQTMWECQPQTVILHYPAEKPWHLWSKGKPLYEINLFRQYAKLFEPNVTKWISFKEDRKVWINLSQSRKGTKWISQKLKKRKFRKGAFVFLLRHLKIKFKQKGLIGTLLFRSNTRS